MKKIRVLIQFDESIKQAYESSDYFKVVEVDDDMTELLKRHKGQNIYLLTDIDYIKDFFDTYLEENERSLLVRLPYDFMVKETDDYKLFTASVFKDRWSVDPYEFGKGTTGASAGYVKNKLDGVDEKGFVLLKNPVKHPSMPIWYIDDYCPMVSLLPEDLKLELKQFRLKDITNQLIIGEDLKRYEYLYNMEKEYDLAVKPGFEDKYNSMVTKELNMFRGNRFNS